MDRTAWIVVGLCVIGLVVWEVLSGKTDGPKARPSEWRAPSSFCYSNSSDCRGFAITDGDNGSCADES